MAKPTQFLLTMLLAAAPLAAQTPDDSSISLGSQATYRGELMQQGGPAEGRFDFELDLYDAADGGTFLGRTIRLDVPVSRGAFAVDLDFLASLSGTEPRWLEISVRPSGFGPFTKLEPRQLLAKGSTFACAISGDLTVGGTLFAGSVIGDGGGLTGVGAADLVCDRCVAAGELGLASIETEHIDSLAVTSDKLADNTVLEPKIANGAVTGAKIAAGAVTAGKIVPGAVGSAHLARQAVTSAKIGDGAVTTGKISPSSIVAGHLAADAVLPGNVASGAIQPGDLAANTVDTPQVVDAAVTGAKVAPGSLPLDRLSRKRPVVVGNVLLTQPEFDVAGFNEVIAEADLTAASPVVGPEADTFEPFVLVSVRPSVPPPDATGNFVEYQGDISWQVVIKNVPPASPASLRVFQVLLQFRLETQPLPPLPDGSPDPNDPAPAGSEVVANYRALFLSFQ